MTYRKDIDGLRALAVLAVIFYHLDFFFVPGGFIGVDIFFVISGFLITQTIQQDIQEKKFTITHFYIKRIRRIVPALFFITMIVILFSFFFLPKNELNEFLWSVVSVSTFTSNIFFWQHSDYFFVTSELKPLLHTWSLGIEEQFYIFFPVFMLLSYKLSNKKILLLLSIFLLSSFILSASPMATNHLNANFFLPFTRFWELLIGSLLALVIKYNNCNKTINNFISLVGLLLIFISIVTLDSNSVFPGINALYPVLGAVLIIYSAASTTTYLSNILSIKYIRYIGFISYSLYLWHWPIIALSKNIVVGDFTITMQLSILILTFTLSTLTYFFIEQPFRINKKLKKILELRNGFITLFILALIAVIALLIMTINSKEAKKEIHKSANCFHKIETLESTKRCSLGDQNASKILVLYGDSHSAAMIPAFEKLAFENSSRIITISIPGCAPLFGVFRNDGLGTSSSCTGEYSKNIEIFLNKNRESIDMVFLVARWDLYEKGYIKRGRLQKETHFLSDQNIESKNAKDSSQVLKKALIRTITTITEKFNIKTSVLETVPILHGDIRRRGIENTTKEEYLIQKKFISNSTRTLKSNPLLTFINPINIFCETDLCKMFDKKEALYTDDNHLSEKGSLLLYPLLQSTLNKEGLN